MMPCSSCASSTHGYAKIFGAQATNATHHWESKERHGQLLRDANACILLCGHSVATAASHHAARAG